MSISFFNLLHKYKSDELPTIVINDEMYSGYRQIYCALKSHYASLFPDEPNSLICREFMFQMNQDLLIEEFSNEEIYRNLTESALLSAKSRYWWNFASSRIYPLTHQVSSISPSSISQIAVNLKEFILIVD